MSYLKLGLTLSVALVATIFSIPALAFVAGEPVISYVSGSGPHPLGTREVEIVVATDIDAKCRGNATDSGEYQDWRKYLTTTDNRVHRIRTPLKSDDNIHRYIRCRSINEQVSNSESFAFPITFANSDTVATPANFAVDRSVSEDGYFTLSWDAVQGAPYLMLKEQHNDGLWNDVAVTDNSSSIDLHRPTEGNYLYKVAACSDSSLTDCSAFSSTIAVWVGQVQTGEAPVISYVSGSGPHPYGIDEVEIVISTNINAVCRGNIQDSGHYDDWKKTLNTTDNRLHRITTPVSGAGDTQRYLRCQATDTQAVNTESFVFEISISSPSNLAKPANFKVDNPINSGNYNLSWKPVDGAVTYLLKESSDGENWSIRLLDAAQTDIDMSKNEDGEYQYYVFACEDELGLECGPCSDHITVTVTGSSGNNLAPTITSTPIFAGSENVSYQYDVEATDPDAGDVVSFSLTNPPAGMEIITESGLITWIPTTAQIGTHAITVVATDMAGLTDTQTFNLVISDVNEAPLITSIAITTATENSTYSYDVEATDGDVGDSITFSLTTQPEGMTIVPETGLIEWTPSPDQVQDTNVTVVATDLAGATNEQSFMISVIDVNNAPEIRSVPVTAGKELEAYSYQIDAVDADGDTLTYELTQRPASMTISETGLIEWTPAYGDRGEHNVSFVVTDVANASVSQDFVIDVELLPNNAPTADAAIVTGNEDSIIAVTLSGSDSDGDSLTYAVASQPSNGVLTGTVPNLSYTPNTDFNGSDSFTFTVSDGLDTSTAATISLTILNVNDAPVVNAQSLELDEDTNINLTLTGNDIEGDSLTYAVVLQPSNGTLTGTAPDLTYTPNSNFFGNDNFTFIANDGAADSATAIVSISVNGVNDMPLITSSPITGAEEDSNYQYQVLAEDTDGDILTYSLVESPVGMTIDVNSGLIGWTPSLTDFGNHNISVQVSDGILAVNQNYTLNVVYKPSNPPVIESSAKSEVSENENYTYNVVASDLDNDPLTYSLSQAPAGMAIDELTGEITWSNYQGFVLPNNNTNEFCQIPGESTSSGLSEMVIAVDTSDSMAKEWLWLEALIPNMEANLISSGVGVGATKNRYGAVGFVKDVFPQLVDDQQMGNAYDLVSHLNLETDREITEDGWNAIDYVIDNYPFQSTSSKTILLVTDEERDDTNEEITFTSLRDKLLENEIVLNVVVNAGFECGDGREALGMNSRGFGFVADGHGGYTICENVRVVEPRFTTETDYINLAKATKGTAWNVQILRQNDISSLSISKAIAEIQTNLIVENLPGERLADISVVSALVENSEAVVTIKNRGLLDVEETITVELFGTLDNVLLASNTINSLLVEQEHTFNFAIDESIVSQENIRIVLSTNAQQCLAENNEVILPLVKVQVTDPRGQFDEQFFSVNVYDIDDDFSLSPIEEQSAFVDINHEYQVVIESLDSSDSYQFSLLQAPLGMEVDKNSGLINFRPLENQIGTHLVEVEVVDLAGNTHSTNWQVTVAEDPNAIKPPKLASEADFIVDENGVYNYQIELVVNNLDDVNYELIDGPDYCSVTSTGYIQCDVTLEQFKTHRWVFVKVSDSYGSDLLAARINEKPIITSTPVASVVSAHYYLYRIVAQDYEGDRPAYFLEEGPDGLEVDDWNGYVSWTPSHSDIGNHSVTVYAEDDYGLKTFQTFTISVSLNQPPQFSSTPETELLTGHQFSYYPTVVDPDGDNPRYSLVSGPSGLSVISNGRTLWTPGIEDIGSHLVTIEVTDNYGGFDQQSFTLSVTENSAPEITSTPGTEAIARHQYRYDAAGSDIDGDILIFSLVNGPEDAFMTTSGRLTWTPQEQDIGDHSVTIEASDRAGGTAQQSFVISVVPNNAPVFTSTPPTTIDAGSVYAYDAKAIDADGDGITFSLQSSPSGMSTSTAGRIRWSTSESDAGIYTIIVNASDRKGGDTTQTFDLRVNGASLNLYQVPASETLYTNTIYNFVVKALHPTDEVISYRLVTPPVGMTIDSTTGLIMWPITANDIGVYSISVIAESVDGQTDQGDFTLTVENNRPVINSNPKEYAKLNLEYQYQVDATDADQVPLSYQLTTAPDGMSVSAEGLITWSPELVGEYRVSLEVSDGDDVTVQDWSVNVSDGLLAIETTLTPAVLDEGESSDMTISLTGVAGELIVTAMMNAVEVPLTLEANGNYTATLTPTTLGQHIIQITATDSVESIVANELLKTIDPDDTSAPEVSLDNLSNGQSITAPTDIIATVSDSNLDFWRLFYKETGSSIDEFTVLAEGFGEVDQDVIGKFDPTMLKNGQYVIVLDATTLNGLTAQANVTLVVEGDLKVGNFTVSFEDINIPLAGIPIQVTRTYDSRLRANALDFGYGWTIDYQNVKLHESQQPTQGWYQESSHSTFLIENELVNFPSTCTISNSVKVVTVTLPNGDVEKFTPRAHPVSGGAVSVNDPNCTLSGGRFINLSFEAQEGTDSELVSLDGQSLYLSNVNGGNLALDIIETAPKDVKAYQLTTRTGYIYKLDQYFGVETITDPNGNTITYSDSGIVHSSGKAVTFNRDAQGRILDITDPQGNLVSYVYGTSGNLENVTNQESQTTSFTYNSEHGLLDIIDPLSRNIVKNIYDDSGRLIAQEDKDGNRTDFVHDLAGRQSVVTDRLGNVTTLYYDDEGNVTSQVDALNGVTSFTYDANGNQLSKTDALGRVSTATFNDKDDQLTQTDALDNVVSFTYNERGQELTVTDERDNVFTNVYDAVGNLMSITDPQSNVVSNTINAQGLPTLVTDALGNETSYTYDEEGNKLTETDALGNVMSYTYDDNNNVLTETRSRTLADSTVVDETTSYTYDKLNRMITTTNALGQTSSVEYDDVGNQVASVDALNRRTEMDYDAYGRVIETRYHDGTSDSKTYDVEGNLLTETDRNGNVTSFEYDKLNRLVKTTYADNSFTETEYDAVGQVIASIDANGNRTEFEYDLAGRRIKTKDALGNEHQYSYDKSGNVLTETDALSRVTSYVYDKLDRKTQTIFANLSTMSDGYDALARRTSTTDQAGVATNYAYDALGRLLSVTDVAGNVTSFTYDESGNKLTQTDAEGRTTSWTYDALGRVLTRTLPLGQVETSTYDAVGNMATHTDFNGELKTYTYDSNNRVTLITYAKDSSTESFTYDNNGNRLTATNAEGTWTYTYDVMNRLASETQPNGDKLEYGYDNNGNKIQLKVTYANGAAGNEESRIENSTYDVLNRLKTVTDADGNVTTYDYDAVGNRVSVTHSNANVTSYVYDELNRLTQMQDKRADESLFQQFDYTLHATGRRTKIEELSGRVSDYTYDSLYRLTDEVITDPVNGNYAASYTFDKVGNRVASTINGVSTVYTYDNNDRLTQEGGEHYTYDDNGNTLTKTIDSDITTYTYDARQRLVHAEITESGVSKTLNYRYNVDGIRNQKVEDGTITNYLVDSNRDYAQVVAEIDSANVVNAEYVFGDDLLAQKRGAVLSSYHYDGLGSTRALTDSSGSISAEYFYDAFGVELARTGSTVNDYLFTGEQYDAGLGNYYLRARYYDQNSGRFTQQDTWMGLNFDPITLHKYLYANADPVSYIDPTGNYGIGQFLASVRAQAKLLTTAVANYSVVVAQTVGRFVANRSLALARNFVVQVNRLANGARKVANVGRAIGRAVKAFWRFTRNKKFKNAQGRHYVDLWGPSGLNTPKKKIRGTYRRMTKKIFWRWNRQGGPGRVFMFEYKVGTNGNSGKGTGFKFRLDYQDYTTYPSTFRPHYHLCYSADTSCKDHHYL